MIFMTLHSQMGGLELTSPWAIDQAALAVTRRPPPHPYDSSQPNKFSRTHTIIGNTEAMYCRCGCTCAPLWGT